MKNRQATRRSLERATDWVDDSDNYRVNEIAINWNAPLIYALAASLPEAR